MISVRNASVSGRSNTPYPSTGVNRPRTRVTGDEPTLRCKSLPPSRTSRLIRSSSLPPLTISSSHLSQNSDLIYLNSQALPSDNLYQKLTSLHVEAKPERAD